MVNIRVALCISGGGSTAYHIMERIATSTKPTGIATPVLIASSQAVADAFAQRHWNNIAAPARIEVAERIGTQGNMEYGDKLIEICRRYDVTHFGQYGWMEMTPINVVGYFGGGRRMVNQHPDDPRLFGGHRLYGRRVLAARLGFARCTKDPDDQFVTPVAQYVGADGRYDSGAVFAVERIAIDPKHDVESLKDQTIIAEHALQWRALEMMRDGRDAPIDLGPIRHSVERDTTLAWTKKVAIKLYPKG